MTWLTTTKHHPFRIAAVLAAVALLAACSGTSSPSSGASTADRRLPTAWLYANHDLSNTRETTDSSIDSSDVSQLGIAWTHPITGVGAYGGAASTPLITNGTVYFQDLGSNVTALNVDDGSKVWNTTFNDPVIGPNGPAINGSSVVAASSRNEITSLDAATGSKQWTTKLVNSPTAGIDIQPVAYDGLVYTSTVPGNQSSFYAGGDAGIITALHGDTGKTAWTFDTVKSPDLWGDPKVNSGGGAWYPPAIDESTGTSYWGIGNPAPWPGTSGQPNGSSRPGDNLYTDSIVALDHATGKLQWYDQVRTHDLFDLDFQSSPILVAASGSQPAEVIGSGKAGVVVAFDPTSGKQLWSTPVGVHKNDDLQTIPSGKTVTVEPGPLGGVETPMAYGNGMVYAAVDDLPARYTSTAFQASSFDPSTGTGEFVAIDATTGKIAWSKTFPSMALGGATVVNDVVFTATYDGHIYAYNATTGQQLWTYDSPVGINAWPAVAGDTLVWPAGVASGNQKPQLLAFRIGATGQIAASTSPSTTSSPTQAQGGTTPGQQGTPNGTPLVVRTPDGTVFTPTTLQAKAGSKITVEYDNESSLPHDLHFFAGPDASAPSLATTKVATGPDVQKISFTTPSKPGTYFFQCDVHPEIMTGTLVVK
jgi:outer membrane protein assembly factor BamB